MSTTVSQDLSKVLTCALIALSAFVLGMKVGERQVVERIQVEVGRVERHCANPAGDYRPFTGEE